MKRTLAVIGFLILMATMPALAGDPIYGGKDYMGESRFYGEVDLRKTIKMAGTELTSTATELNQLDGVVATADELDWAANRSVDSTANVTNTQVVTLDFTCAINVLKSVGANDSSNVCTFANVSAANVGKSVIVQNITGATNSFAVALTGNYYGPALMLGAGESAVIYSTATNKLYSYGAQ